MTKLACMVATCCHVAASIVTAQAQSADSVRIERTKDNHSIVSLTVPLSDDEGELQAKFDFGETRGFLGSSRDPGSQGGFVNADRTIIAVNHQPLTKSSYVHIWLRLADGDLMFMNKVNERVARLLKGRFAESARYFLRMEAIAGRKISLQTVDFAGKGERYDFAVTVTGPGQLSLAR